MSVSDRTEWEVSARLYSRVAANRRSKGRKALREAGDEEGVPMTKQAVAYRVKSLEVQAGRLAFIAARSAAFRAYFMRALLSYSGEPWFEAYSGADLGDLDAVVSQIALEARSAVGLRPSVGL